MGCGGCCRYFPCLRFTIGVFTFLAFLMGSLAFIAPAWLERDIDVNATRDLDLVDYETYSYGVISSGGIYKFDRTTSDNGTESYTETKYVWAFNDSWSQWSSLEDKAVMIIYAAGMLFILISLWNIAITECVPIKNQSTMLIMMVVWDVLAALCIGAAVIVFCATWHNNDTLKAFCQNSEDEGTQFKAFSLGVCQLSWAIYGAVATACTCTFLAVFSGCASRRALNDHQYAVKRNGVGSRENINTTWM